MKRLFLAVLFVVVAPFTAFAWNNSAMNRQIDQTNFLVNDNCSATLIDKDKGLLLTASHCVEGQYTVVEREKIDDKGIVTKEKVRIATPGTVSQLFFSGTEQVSQTKYVYKIVKSGSADNGIDLALIQVLTKLPNVEAAKVACTDPARGELAFAVGNPLGRMYASVSNGIVASVNRNYRMLGLDREQGLLQTTTPIGGGSSGGAVYNDDGKIIGVAVRGYQTIAPVALSVPLSDIKAFLSDTDAKVDCP